MADNRNATAGVGAKIKLGVLWSGISLLLRRGLGFAIGLLLTRLLTPEDYGLVGMAFVFTRFANVISEAGMAAAIIQFPDEYIRIDHYHTSFWSGLIWSTVIFLLIYFVVAPFAVHFYNEPQLAEILPLLSLPLLVSTYGAVARAKLTRNFDFKSLAFIDNIATFSAGLIAIIIAFSGGGVWALVVFSITPIVVSIPLFYWRSRYLPAFVFTAKGFKEVFGFSSKNMGTNLTNTFIGQLDYLVVSKLVSKFSLGIYTFAFTLTELLRSQIMHVVNSVMFVGYSRAQGNVVLLQAMYRKVVRYNALVIYPVSAILFTFANPIIDVFFGPQWLDAAPIIKVLSLASCVHMLVNSNTSLIRGMGHAGLEFGLQLFKGLVVFAPLVIWLVYEYEAIGAAYAVVINRIVAVPIAYYVLNRLIGLQFLDIIKDLSGVIIGFLLMVVIGNLLLWWLPESMAMLVGIPIMGLSYGGVCAIAYPEDLSRLRTAVAKSL